MHARYNAAGCRLFGPVCQLWSCQGQDACLEAAEATHVTMRLYWADSMHCRSLKSACDCVQARRMCRIAGSTCRHQFLLGISMHASYGELSAPTRLYTTGCCTRAVFWKALHKTCVSSSCMRVAGLWSHKDLRQSHMYLSSMTVLIISLRAGSISSGLGLQRRLHLYVGAGDHNLRVFGSPAALRLLLRLWRWRHRLQLCTPCEASHLSCPQSQ